MPPSYVGNGVILALWGCTAMNNNLGDFPLALDAPRRSQSLPSLCPNNTVTFEIVSRLERSHSLIGDCSKYSVNGEAEFTLQGFNSLPARA